jgi:hypothetical protein
MTVRVEPGAQQDVRRAATRLESERRGFGNAFAREFGKALAAIGANPRMYGRTEDGPDEPENREYYIERFEYRVIYLVVNDEPVVVSLTHARKPPGSWLHRLPDYHPEEPS